MTETLEGVTGQKKRPEPTAEQVAAKETVRQARKQGLCLTGPGGLLKQLTKNVIGDSPRWRDVPDHPAVARTPTKRLVTMADVADATEFLLRNPGVNGHDLNLDGGMIIS